VAIETQVQRNIIGGLVARGAWYTKCNQTGRGRKGVPDLLCCYRGLFLAIEVKGDSGHVVSVYQVKELRDIRTAGGLAIVARSWSDVKWVLDEIDADPLAVWGLQPVLPKLKVVAL